MGPPVYYYYHKPPSPRRSEMGIDTLYQTIIGDPTTENESGGGIMCGLCAPLPLGLGLA